MKSKGVAKDGSPERLAVLRRYLVHRRLKSLLEQIAQRMRMQSAEILSLASIKVRLTTR
jgi:hypothetical protein